MKGRIDQGDGLSASLHVQQPNVGACFVWEQRRAGVDESDVAAVGRPVGRQLEAAGGIVRFRAALGERPDRHGRGVALSQEDGEPRRIRRPCRRVAQTRIGGQSTGVLSPAPVEPNLILAALDVIDRSGDRAPVRGEAARLDVAVGGPDRRQDAALPVDPRQLRTGYVLEVGDGPVPRDAEIGGSSWSEPIDAVGQRLRFADRPARTQIIGLGEERARSDVNKVPAARSGERRNVLRARVEIGKSNGGCRIVEVGKNSAKTSGLRVRGRIEYP